MIPCDENSARPDYTMRNFLESIYSTAKGGTGKDEKLKGAILGVGGGWVGIRIAILQHSS